MSDLAAIEREKYQKVWEFEVYRNYSPSEQLIRANAELFRAIFTGQQVAEYGSGTGRGSRMLWEMGYAVTMVDHCDNALDEDVRECLNDRFTFSQQNLWQMKGIETDHFICIDVMEHIPPVEVEAVLAAIARQTRDGGVFEICVVPDNLGKRTIGEPLHLAVLSPAVWLSLIEMHFQIAWHLQPNPRSIIVFVKKLPERI